MENKDWLLKKFKEEIDKESDEVGGGESPNYHIGMETAYGILEEMLENKEVIILDVKG